MLSLRMLRRAITAALATVLLTAGTALADFVPPDANQDVVGLQNMVDLGEVAPGAVLTRTVTFELVCAGIRHADPGQTVLLAPFLTVTPDPALGGSISATSTTIGPVPATWANDTHGVVGCPTPNPRLAANGPSTVTVVAPNVAGLDYEFTIFFNKTLSPPGVNDLSSVAGLTAVTYRLDVVDVDTTPPVLHDVPAGLDLVTGDPAGATLVYVPPTATDDRDPAPTVACDPPPGSVAPLGASEVACTATDAAGNTATASFPVAVHLVTVTWEEPVGEGGSLTVHGQRSVPVKVQAWLDGVPVTSGEPELVVSPCGASPGEVERVAEVEYQPDADRWMGHLSTAGLAFGCHRVELVAGGVSFGGFTLDLQAAAAARAKGSKPS